MAQSEQKMGKTSRTPVIKVAEMVAGRPMAFEIVFDAEQKTAGVAQLDLLELQKLRFAGTLTPLAKSDWALKATLGATATQACVVTLDPVKSRVDVDVERRFLRDWEEPEGDTVSEMDEDVESEPLGEEIDLAQIALEALALALPDYPRKDDAALEETVFAQDGVKPMTDEDAKPFAGLAALKEKMEKDG